MHPNLTDPNMGSWASKGSAVALPGDVHSIETLPDVLVPADPAERVLYNLNGKEPSRNRGEASGSKYS